VKISKKEEQHTLGSQWLHEVANWCPPRLRRKKPPEQLPGQTDLVELLADESDDA
jgi:hypothetical protein